MSQLETTYDQLAIKNCLNDILSVRKTHDTDEISDIALDFYYDCYCFCCKLAFSERKTAAFLSIIHDAFVKDTCNEFNWTMSKSYDRLESVIFKHSIERPPDRYTSRFTFLLFNSLTECVLTKYSNIRNGRY